MSDQDYILDLSTQPAADNALAPQAHGPKATARPWLAIHWRCCHVYSRVYRQKNASHYLAQCPCCGRSATIQVAPHGVSTRFLEAFP